MLEYRQTPTAYPTPPAVVYNLPRNAIAGGSKTIQLILEAIKSNAYISIIEQDAAETLSAVSYFEIGPERTIQEMAAQHRKRHNRLTTQSSRYVDEDIPWVDDGADW